MGTPLQRNYKVVEGRFVKSPPSMEFVSPFKKAFLFVVCMLFINVAAFANHFKGGQITYESRGGGQYMITIKSYWVNGKLDNIVPIYSGSPAINSPMTTLAINPLSDGTTTERVEQQLVTWTNPGLYTISWTSCCRISGGSNFSMTPVGLFAAIKYDPANPSSSPQFYDVPVFNFVAGVPMSFNLNVEDPDKHDQDVTLNTPYGIWGNPYALMNNTGFRLGTNGDVTWSNPQRGLWLVNVKFAERVNGVLTGAYVFRDFMLNVNSTTNLAPVFSAVAPVAALETQPISFQVSVTDANGDAVSLQANGLPFSNGATFVQNTQGSAVTGTFTWTPPTGSARNYSLQFIATDNAGVPLSTQITVSLDVTAFAFMCNLSGNAVPQNATCPGASDGNIEVTIAGSGNYNYSIDGGNTYQSSNMFRNLPAGNYDIMVNDGGACTGNFSAIVGEDARPVVAFANQAAVCANAGVIALTGASPAGGNFSGAGVVNNMFDPAVAGVGIHTLTYTYANANGCSNSATATIEVKDSPVANAGTNQVVYYGYAPNQCATLSASATGGTGVYTYAWSNGETGSSISVCPTATTVYTVTVTDASGCSDESQVTVFVNDVHCGNKNNKVVVCHNGKDLCIAAAAVSAHLAHGDQLGSCGSNISNGNNGVGNQMNVAKLQAYPNPLSLETTLQFESATSGMVSLMIYDLKGNVIKNVFSGEVVEGQPYSQTVNMDGLASGIYVATLVTPDEVQNLKVIVTR